ncbi:hypothetical protein Afil01_40430 [Actinorhabdospora filicis]|uniref:Nucleotide exchange factor GrpE n=1 Tax=Actinorhabdospora filicis TaxID=1785913 RepID=A0A9W6WB54_9ACTN|nr:hypothetical protein [Actinorhabdospora filicis]GLZ79236.1 hypothetical protein Afil01_40430 [Actinorhabdospora filicis]
MSEVDDGVAVEAHAPVTAAAVEALRAELAAHGARAAAREELIIRLHDEVQRLRTGERAALLRPVIADLGRLRNALARQAAQAGEAGVLFAGFADEVGLSLERVGASPVSPKPGEPVEIGAHRVVGVVETGDAGLDGTVASVDADGYFDGLAGKVVVPALVRAHRLKREEEQ